MTETIYTPLQENGDQRTYMTKILHEFGQFAPEFQTKRDIAGKVADLWAESSQYDVLFTDYTKGSPESFMDVFFDPRGVWLEILRMEDKRIIGAVYLTKVIPKVDATGHFTLWDSRGRGREPLLWDIMEWIFNRYNLHRITAEIPSYQSGLGRLLKRLGFKEEGERRESRLHKGTWVDDTLYGILKKDLEEARHGIRK